MNRTLIIGARQIVIETLGQPMDQEFDQLHAAYYNNTPISSTTFEAATLQYFDQHQNDPAAHNRYFNCFTVIWQDMLAAGRYTAAEDLWERALQPALIWEQAHQGTFIHKGSPYYFWAMTALLHGDTDKGYLLIHQAVDEDIRTSGQPAPDTPGLALVNLNYARVAQLFHKWVMDQAVFLGRLITDYNTTHIRALTLEQVKQRFFGHPPTPETIFILTYTLARLMKLAALPNHTTRNPFAGQLELNLLFDITLVIDAAIHNKNQADWRFIRHAEYLSDAAGQPLTNPQLRDINNQFENDFDATLRAGLDGTLTVQPNARLTRLQCDIAIAYGLRNQGAHNTGSATTIWVRFADVQHALFRVLFATIEHLHP